MLPINKLMGKKRALLIAVRHVRGLPNFHTTGLADLSWTHRDAINLRGRLIASHGYEAKDVILMLDNQRHPEDLWPTRKNILREMRHLVSDAPEDSQFFLYYSGHGLQEECQDGEEADGKDEEIVAADGKPILDDLIHIRLITPLERVKGSKLFALFDCCHSETLLDLQQNDGPNTYSRESTIDLGQVLKGHPSATEQETSQLNSSLYANPKTRQKSAILSSAPISNTKNAASFGVRVICLSACMDDQIAYDDDERESTFTKCFMDAIAARPEMSWQELRDELKKWVDKVRERYQQFQNNTATEDEQPRRIWAQEPRYSTTPHTDLSEKVEL